MSSTSERSETASLGLAVCGIGVVTAIFRLGLHLTNPTIAALAFLLIVLVLATRSSLRVAIATSVLADFCLNYFFMPPFGTLTIADPQNWVALVAFLAVGAAGSRLSSVERDRAREAMALLEVRKAAELSRKSEELKSALLASLGHDLKTPLTGMRIAASNLQASWLTEADRREQSELILTEIERLSRLFQNILDMARVEAGAMADVRWVHPSEIVEAARDQVAHTLREHRVSVQSESEYLVRLDPRLTASALAHLLENAARYSRPGSEITVEVSVSAEGLVVKVRDRGPGIPPADLPHVFERFYRGTVAPQTAGSGMGLPIARGMLAAERGRIWAENCPDGGAQFTIAVPAESKAATAGQM